MNRVTRLLALVGVAAGVAVGTAPAQAAGTHTATVQTAAHRGDDDYRLVDTFRSPERCVRVGRIGEITGRWDDFACFPFRHGFGRARFALVVSDDDDCDWDDYRNDDLYWDRPFFGERRGGMRHF